VDEKEKYPPQDVIRSDQKLYRVEKILAKKKVKGETYYEVKWVGVKKTTLVPKKRLKEDIPEMVKKFEKS
jgi:hypothetical protein